MESLISIGQLSTNIGVSIRTIRYYEEVGILKPAKTSESNYRYYGRDEMDKLQLILFLKNLGFSLQSIRAALADDGRASILAKVRERQSSLDAELQQMLLKKELLESVVSAIEAAGASDLGAIDSIRGVMLSRRDEIDIVSDVSLPIKVVGVGERVINAINEIADNGAKVDILYVDCDEQSLAAAKTNRKIRSAVIGSELNDALKGSDMLFLVTAPGEDRSVLAAAATIAGEARRMGILTIGIMDRAIRLESEQDRTTLNDNVDMMLQVPNRSTVSTDEFFKHAVTCLSSLLTGEIIRIDLEHIKLLVREKGAAYFGIGKASGKDRAKRAVEYAVASSSGFQSGIGQADSIILNITGSNDLTLSEAKLIAETVRAKSKAGANILFGTVIEKEVQDGILVTIVAAGFEESMHT
ncbi:MerR family transcriptional regulator [Paenibacillus mesophilus]|uniref:MerR family transcriptional regulator n=1 Tax=Paenibacillus mesophilus TaxID=2582849 RepID=UPI00110F6232|nr:MerR family transcriptional regulator [Paenibacillus mesophilus]TMV50052.1 MerR family transcriptional regulator [Paenibacillus mesophilus]